MPTGKLLSYLFNLLILYALNSEQDDPETCTPDNIDYTEHILSMPRNYDCSNTINSNDCAALSEEGYCDIDPGYMSLHCAKQCGFCDLRDPKIRCQRHPNAKQAVMPGDINKMFVRIISDFPEYKAQILSQDPWLIVLNDVFSDKECDTLIEIGGRNFHRSQDAGDMTDSDDAQFETIISDVRTSYTDWCIDDCWNHPIINGMAKKAENITKIRAENSEYFQVLRYEIGQYYREHHDYIYGHLDLPIGPRLLTFFIYLNTPQKGGGTKFPELNVIVQPKKGSVAIWPSVLNEDPFKKEERTNHEALTVEKGVKYAANLWLHQFNFHGPFSLTCTG